MAQELGIKRCWFHNGGVGKLKGCFPHYDIPKKRIQEIQAKCEVVDPRVIHGILKAWAQKNNKWPTAQITPKNQLVDQTPITGV